MSCSRWACPGRLVSEMWSLVVAVVRSVLFGYALEATFHTVATLYDGVVFVDHHYRSLRRALGGCFPYPAIRSSRHYVFCPLTVPG